MRTKKLLPLNYVFPELKGLDINYENISILGKKNIENMIYSLKQWVKDFSNNTIKKIRVELASIEKNHPEETELIEEVKEELAYHINFRQRRKDMIKYLKSLKQLNILPSLLQLRINEKIFGKDCMVLITGKEPFWQLSKVIAYDEDRLQAHVVTYEPYSTQASLEGRYYRFSIGYCIEKDDFYLIKKMLEENLNNEYLETFFFQSHEGKNLKNAIIFNRVEDYPNDELLKEKEKQLCIDLYKAAQKDGYFKQEAREIAKMCNIKLG